MSTERERHIQKQLESFANKRRAETGAPFEMHPATRKLLQAEVARRTLKSPRERHFLSQTLVGLWPRVAFGGSVFALLTLCTWMFFQTQKQPDEPLKSAANVPATQPVGALAANDFQPTSELTVAQVDERTDFAIPGPGDTTQTGKDIEVKQFAARSTSRNLASEKNPADSAGQKYALQSAPVAAPPLAEPKNAEAANLRSEEVDLKPSLAQTETAAKRPAAKLPTRSQSPASPQPSVVPTAQAFYDNKKSDASSTDGLSGVGVTQRFAQLAPLARSSNAAGPANANAVLTSFQMELVGNQVRVIDKDRSTYAGYLQRTEVGSGQPQTAGEKESARSRLTKAKTPNVPPSEKLGYTSATGTNQDYFFRVVGINRSLNQNVIFSGHLLANTPYAESSRTNVNPAARDQLNLPSSNQVLPLLLNSRISGTALIGGSNAVQIQALPVVPK